MLAWMGGGLGAGGVRGRAGNRPNLRWSLTASLHAPAPLTGSSNGTCMHAQLPFLHFR